MAEKLYVKQNIRADKSDGFARPNVDVDGRTEKTIVSKNGEYVIFVVDLGVKGTYTCVFAVKTLKGFNKNPLAVDETGKEFVKENMTMHYPASAKEEPTWHDIVASEELPKQTAAEKKAAKLAAKELQTA